ncbi:hypothetical protein O181_082601 [Austropuccinia psidii MF-1]|uniref:Retrovirus-related Pol polyprotein from transposon TNT 1-94-like beta-barrel domain-containing protein n=1 Tax=Austropuccinia psidii MF-1 TaxID=1389203 RepID=A0A9Q3FSX4_9BASI|nr:hypothetical protein [Austropuccinia psidii MF-1]
MRHLDESIVAFVGNKLSTEEKGDGRALWRMLKEKYVGSGVQAQGVALDPFLELKFKNLDQWIEDLRTSTRRMSLTGTDVNNALVSRLAIRTLPHKYESLVRILTYGNQYTTIEDIIGHILKNCRLRNNNTYNRNAQAKLAENDEEEEPTIAFVATTNEDELCSLVAKKNKTTILDSGANDHMFTKEEDFTNLRPSLGGVQIGQEGVKIPVKGRGKVVKFSKGNRIVFKEAIYVPDLPYNLVSLSQIWKRNGDLERLANNKF